MLGEGLTRYIRKNLTYVERKICTFIFIMDWNHGIKNALHIATGGSFILSSPKESSRALKNIFGNHDKTTREVDDITTLVATTNEIIEKCARRLPNKLPIARHRTGAATARRRCPGSTSTLLLCIEKKRMPRERRVT
jgi:hypothetical protein